MKDLVLASDSTVGDAEAADDAEAGGYGPEGPWDPFGSFEEEVEWINRNICRYKKCQGAAAGTITIPCVNLPAFKKKLRREKRKFTSAEKKLFNLISRLFNEARRNANRDCPSVCLCKLSEISDHLQTKWGLTGFSSRGNRCTYTYRFEYRGHCIW